MVDQALHWFLSEFLVNYSMAPDSGVRPVRSVSAGDLKTQKTASNPHTHTWAARHGAFSLASL